MATNTGKKSKTSIVHKNERVAHWAFMDHIRQGLIDNGKVKPGEKLIIRDAVDGFFGQGEPTGHLLATDGGCFGNNFGLNRIIAYSPWFTYKEGYVAKIFADSEYWHDIIENVPAAIDVVTDLYGIKFDYHCPKNLFEARLVENPDMGELLSKDNETSGFWTSFAAKLWKRPEEPYVGIRFAMAYTQGFRMRHKETPGEELELAKEECRILLKQLAGWKGMRLLIEEQGLKLLALIDKELRENMAINKAATEAIDALESKANGLVEVKQAIYKVVYDRHKMKTGMDELSRVALADKEDEEVYDFSTTETARIHEIDEAIETIRDEIIPHIHEKSRTEGKMADLNCKNVLTKYALDFFTN
ncbi:MAG: hypothetical protein Q8J63_07665 [Candidatus Aquicultor sp.]|nr:hypothetical protein [Candidatus Aquicultor sp.]